MSSNEAPTRRLRESEERLALAIEIGELASWDWDLRSGRVTWSDRHFLIQGYAVGEVTPSLEAWLARVHPEDRAATVALIEAARDEKGTYAHEFRTCLPDGAVRWSSARGRFFYDDAGAPHRMIGVMEDITERKRSEEALRASEQQQAFLLELSDALHPLTDAEEIRFTAASVLGRQLGANCVAYADDAGDGETFLVSRNYVDGASDLAGRYRYDDYGSDVLAELRAGRNRVQPDLANDERLSAAQRRTLVDHGIGAALKVPLVKAGRLVAFIGVHFGAAHAFTAGEIEMVEAVVERAWAAVERAHAEAAQRASEAKYRHLFESVDDAICIVEVLEHEGRRPVDYRFVEVNPAFERHTGLAGVLGLRGSEVAPGSEASWIDICGEIARSGESRRFENCHRATGRWYDVHVSRIVRGESGLVSIFFRDITERKKADEALSEELRNTRILQDLGARVVTADNIQTIYEEILSAALAITRAIAGTVQLLDAATDELVILATRGFSRRTQEYFHRVDAGSNTSCGLALRTGARSYFNFEPASTDLSIRLHVEDGVLSAQSSPLVSRSGKAIGMVSTHWDELDHQLSERELRFLDLLARQAADLIEQRAAEEVLRESEARLQEADQRKNQFLAMLGHELRNPLAAIHSGLQLLASPKAKPESKEIALPTVLGQTAYMERLVDDLLEVTRIVQGRVVLRRGPMVLQEAVGQALEMCRPLSEAASFDIAVDLPREPLSLVGDQVRLTQVFVNILGNAIKYSGGSRRIEVTAAQENGHAVVRVRDYGQGIAAELLPRIFDPFVQAEAGLTLDAGMGMGLAVVKELVRLHDGQVQAHSLGAGQGSEFVVRLPAP